MKFLANLFLMGNLFAATPFGQEGTNNDWFYRAEIHDFNLIRYTDTIGDVPAIVVTWTGLHVDDNYNHEFSDNQSNNPPDGTFVKNLHLYPTLSKYDDSSLGTELTTRITALNNGTNDVSLDDLTLVILNNAVDCTGDEKPCDTILSKNGGVVSLYRFRVDASVQTTSIIKKVIYTGMSCNPQDGVENYVKKTPYLYNTGLDSCSTIEEDSNTLTIDVVRKECEECPCDNCLVNNDTICPGPNYNPVKVMTFLPTHKGFNDVGNGPVALNYDANPTADPISETNFCYRLEKPIKICGTNMQTLHMYLPSIQALSGTCDPVATYGPYTVGNTYIGGIVSSQCAMPRSVVIRVKDNTSELNTDSKEILIGNFGVDCEGNPIAHDGLDVCGGNDCEDPTANGENDCMCKQPIRVCGLDSNHGTVILDHTNATPTFITSIANKPAVLRKMVCS